jgi:hypothetical protein
LVTGYGNRWTRERVTSLRSHHRIPVYKPADDGIEPWLNLSKAAQLLHVAPKTLRLAAEAGEIESMHPLPDGPWIYRQMGVVMRGCTPAKTCAPGQRPGAGATAGHLSPERPSHATAELEQRAGSRHREVRRQQGGQDTPRSPDQQDQKKALYPQSP